MPILPSAKKALRSSQRKAMFNQRIKARVRTLRKQMKQNPTQENLELTYSAIDKAVKANIFHSNKGARLKSQMARLLTTAPPEKTQKKKTSKTAKVKSEAKTSNTKKKTSQKSSSKKKASS